MNFITALVLIFICIFSESFAVKTSVCDLTLTGSGDAGFFWGPVPGGAGGEGGQDADIWQQQEGLLPAVQETPFCGSLQTGHGGPEGGRPRGNLLQGTR